MATLVKRNYRTFDNLFDEDIVDCFRETRFDETTHDLLDPLNVSECIAKKSEKMSYIKEYDSPFSINARKHNKSYPGGKKDDITVIVA